MVSTWFSKNVRDMYRQCDEVQRRGSLVNALVVKLSSLRRSCRDISSLERTSSYPAQLFPSLILLRRLHIPFLHPPRYILHNKHIANDFALPLIQRAHRTAFSCHPSSALLLFKVVTSPSIPSCSYLSPMLSPAT